MASVNIQKLSKMLSVWFLIRDLGREYVHGYSTRQIIKDTQDPNS